MWPILSLKRTRSEGEFWLFLSRKVYEDCRRCVEVCKVMKVVEAIERHRRLFFERKEALVLGCSDSLL